MDLKVRGSVIWASILLGCAVLFMPLFKKNDSFYTINEFNEDVSKIYSDLGLFSQKRGDFQGAIKSYTRALEYNPEHAICLSNIEICKKKLKKNISKAVDFLAKLDSSN